MFATKQNNVHFSPTAVPAGGKGCFVQPKLNINPPDDIYEHEADTVAEKVVSMEGNITDVQPMPVTAIQRKCTECEEEEKKGIQRKCDKCAEEDKQSLQRKENANSSSTQDTSLVSKFTGNNSSGEDLPATVRNYYEPRFGYDFGNVRIHTDTTAAKSAQSINALAYTSGNNIVFNNGQYSPDTTSGKKLLAHELTHVVQQQSAVQTKTIQRLGDPSKIPAGLACTPATDNPTSTAAVVMFDNASTALTRAGRTTVDGFAASWVAAGANTNIRLDGYASTAGSDELNWRLSCERAIAVKDELIVQGVSPGYINVFMQGETGEFGGAGNNRRVNIQQGRPPGPVVPPPITPSDPPSCPAITVGPVGTSPAFMRGGCGGGPDFAINDFVPPTPLPPLSTGESLMMASLTPQGTGALQTLFSGELGTLGGAIGSSMASRFIAGTAGTMSHTAGSALETAVNTSPTFARLTAVANRSLNAEVRAQATYCNIDPATIALTGIFSPNFSVTAGDTLQLNAVLGGTQGLKIFITAFSVAPGTRTYTATLRFEICDDFGVDDSDLRMFSRGGWRPTGHGSPGLFSFWILQHQRASPGNMPFINEVILETSVTDSF